MGKNIINEEIKEKIILALDVDSENEALKLVTMLKDYVGYFKIGLGLLNNSEHPNKTIKKIVNDGNQIFFDCKLHDIPNTVAAASRGITRRSINMFNLHIMGGIDMIKASVEATKMESKKLSAPRPLILGVTLLTSISRDEMNTQLRIPGSTEEHVSEMAKIADKAGLDGVIASPQEIEIIKDSISRHMLIVTPGIRPTWSSLNDQKRSMPPSKALSKGATHIVIGRAITKPPDAIGTPIDAIKMVIEEISNGII